MLCAPGFFSRRYAPNPRPSWPANSGVNSVFTRPRTSYSRNTCRGMAMARGIYARPSRRTRSSEDERQQRAGHQQRRAADQSHGRELALRLRVRFELCIGGGERARGVLAVELVGGGRSRIVEDEGETFADDS